ncbi:TetR family transcriptional regulator [Haloactinopolyspora alba]|uniref:TetR family transcriptional regulator n=1 Tax=Haloactinopolyspora alba TaxID=648780 RepID=A0A2P8DL14_9ACTN|nr:TetR/AcrR family transcriptional regulator [Haloactinopolyspora alba]PSK97888.1 TetR family transcriptional regulator [Haloactinopolyspora alba]
MADEPIDATVADDRPAEQPAMSRRERARAATVDEIKNTALQLMREQGTTDFRFSDIARHMGMTAPALYRYFADRDELLTQLIVDAFADLGAAVAEERDRLPKDDPGGRFFAVAQAYRRWALGESQRFALILGMPVPGYAAPDEGSVTEAARGAMIELKSLFFDAIELGVLREPRFRDAPDPVCRFTAGRDDPMQPDDAPALSAETFQAMLHCWTALHGFTSLEAYGHLDWLPADAREGIFETNMRVVADAAGLPPPANAANSA